MRVAQSRVVVRAAEIAFGLLWAVPSSIWIVLVGRFAVEHGFGWGIEPDVGGCIQSPGAPVVRPGAPGCVWAMPSFPPQADVGWPYLAVFVPIALLGLLPFSLGLSFVLGVGPLAKPREQVSLG